KNSPRSSADTRKRTFRSVNLFSGEKPLQGRSRCSYSFPCPAFLSTMEARMQPAPRTEQPQVSSATPFTLDIRLIEQSDTASLINRHDDGCGSSCPSACTTSTSDSVRGPRSIGRTHERARRHRVAGHRPSDGAYRPSASSGDRRPRPVELERPDMGGM